MSPCEPKVTSRSPALDRRLAVEQLEVAGRGGAPWPVVKPTSIGGLEPHAHRRLRVDGEQHGGGRRADRLDPADQAVAVEHRHVRPQAVPAAGVEGDRPGEGLRRPDRDDLGRHDLVAPGAGQVQQVVELLRRGGGRGRRCAAAACSSWFCCFSRRGLVPAVAEVADAVDGVADRARDGRGHLLDRAEDRRGGRAHAVQRRAVSRRGSRW